MRETEAWVAGHSDAVFREHYDTQAAQTSQVALMALQEDCDTISPLQSLNFEDSHKIGSDRKQRLKILKQKAEDLRREKKSLRNSQKDPATLGSVVQFLDKLLQVDFYCLDEKNG